VTGSVLQSRDWSSERFWGKDMRRTRLSKQEVFMDIVGGECAIAKEGGREKYYDDSRKKKEKSKKEKVF